MFKIESTCFQLSGKTEEEGAAMEFFFSGTFRNSASGVMNKVSLMEDGNVVATAVYSFDNGNMFRNAFLFYKAKVDAGESKNYYVEIESDASVNSFEIKALDFSWGYRTYTDAYPLETDIPTC